MKTVIYLDTYIFVNTLFNYAITTLCLLTLKIVVRPLKILVVSTLSSALSLFIMFGLLQSVPTKFVLVLITVFLLLKGSIKLKIKFTCLHYIYSYVLAGIMLSINNVTNIIKINSTDYSSLSVGGIILSIFAMLILILITRKTLLCQLKKTNIYKTVTITYDEKTISLIGYCDTGNTLYDFECMCPVFIATKSIIKKLSELEFTKNMTCSTISGTGVVKVFKPDKIMIENKCIDAMIGVSNIIFNNDYDLLLTADILDDNFNVKNAETESLIC